MEMWGAASFDRATIARELDFAAGLGMNALRVFLHDLAWSADPAGFLARFEAFLAMAAGRGLAVMPVLFDDCWHEPGNPGPHAGPRPGTHNSMWLRSPGLQAARSQSEAGRLEAYVRAVGGAHARDRRILAWDVYNEVGNFFLPHLSSPVPARQVKLLAVGLSLYLRPSPTLPLLRAAFTWCRSEDPDQPLTSPLWFQRRGLNRELIDLSDVVSFHNYRPAAELARQIAVLEAEGRPLLCTEYLARPEGSRFESCLPVFETADVGCFNWGLVSGRTQTIFSWTDRGIGEPALWFHDILRPDGSPFDPAETAALRKAAGRLGRRGGTDRH